MPISLNICRLWVSRERARPRLRQGRRATVTIRVGKPFGPLQVDGKGRERRRQLDALGDEIMQQIAALIPPQTHGVYAADPALRQAAAAVAAYPYHDLHITGIQRKDKVSRS